MKKKGLITGLFIIIITVCVTASVNYCDDFRNVLKAFKENCYNTPDFNSINEKFLIANFVQYFDPNQVYFNINEINELENIISSAKLHPENSYCFIKDQLLYLCKKSLENSLSILEKLNMSEIKFDKEDSIYNSDVYNPKYYKTDIRQRWLSFIKYQILENIVTSTSAYDSINKIPGLMESNITGYKEKVIDRESGKIKEILNDEVILENIVYFKYINSLLLQFDPHSFYFSKDMFTGFQEQLSPFSNSYGIQLEKDQYGKYIVSSIEPGSYAWRTGQINIGDEITEIQTDGEEPLKTEGINIEDIIYYIDSSSGEKLTLTIHNKSNEQKKVAIYKETLKNQENTVQCYVLNGVKKTGYILLPAFYTSWESDNTFGCAQDVAKAIYGLKKENIESLIIDLRNNGGGSIKEAIELAGIFIDFGTLSTEQNNKKELLPLKDFNRGVMYSGPLAVLTNNYSASASEMVVAVLQDYNRAIITGGKTFGKATGQVLLPVTPDNSVKKIEDASNLNILKVTQSRYFRVTGKSYQKTGVTPDVYLPNISALFNLSESEYINALNNDSINKKTYYKPLMPPIPVDILSQKSRERVLQNDKFIEIIKIDSLLMVHINKYSFIPLNINKYYTYVSENESLMAAINLIKTNPTHEFSVENISGEKEILKMYPHFSCLQEQLKKSVIIDPYIEETYNVLNDYVNFLNNHKNE